MRHTILLMLVLGAGCTSNGPYRVTKPGGMADPMFTRTLSRNAFGEQFGVDEVTGGRREVFRWAQVERMTPAEFEVAVAEERARQDERRETWRRQAAENAAADDARNAVRHSAYRKDWQGWYDAFVRDGYTPAEAELRANELAVW